MGKLKKKDLDGQSGTMLYLFGDVTGLFFMSGFYKMYLIYGGEICESKDYFSMYRMQTA